MVSKKKKLPKKVRTAFSNAEQVGDTQEEESVKNLIMTRNILVPLTRCDDPHNNDGATLDLEDFKQLILTSRKKKPVNSYTSKSSGEQQLSRDEMAEPPGDISMPQEEEVLEHGETVRSNETSNPSESLMSIESPGTKSTSAAEKPKETTTEIVAATPFVNCYACVLWSPAVKTEIDLHKSIENRLFSTLGIGRLLSDKVIMENCFMDWKKPFLLVDVIYREGITALKDTDGSYLIPVVEKDAIDNEDIPVHDKAWDLHISGNLSHLAQEILRCPPTTVMIWGARKCPVEAFTCEETEQQHQHKSRGEIYIDLDFGPINIIIFHSEVISNERIRGMKGDFGSAELGAFRETYRRRICHCFTDGGTFAVHFSRLKDAKYFSVPGKQEIIPIPMPAVQQ